MTCDDLRDSYELYSLGLLDGEERRESKRIWSGTAPSARSI